VSPPSLKRKAERDQKTGEEEIEMKKSMSILILLTLSLLMIAANPQILRTKKVSADGNWSLPINYDWSNWSMISLPIESLATPSNTPISGALTPAQIRQIYNLPSTGSQCTIAIIDPYDDPTIMNDANMFCSEYNLPNLTSDNFEKIQEPGAMATADINWTREISMDVEWAHAIAPSAKIKLVEAINEYELFNAVEYARNQPDVNAISMSWGYQEQSGETYVDQNLFQYLPPLAMQRAASSPLLEITAKTYHILPARPAWSV
jgi:subtilase family serine protease